VGGFIVASCDTRKWFLRIYGITFVITDLTRVNKKPCSAKIFIFFLKIKNIN